MSRKPFRPGDTVLVEGVVTGYEAGQPYGAVLVTFPAATDEFGDQDGIQSWHPQALIFRPGVDVFFDEDAIGNEEEGGVHGE